MRQALISMDHKQPVTPLNTDNSATEGLLNSGIKQNRPKK